MTTTAAKTKGAAGPMNGPDANDITSFMVRTDRGEDIYYSEGECRQQDVAGMIEGAIDAHGRMCTVTAYHDHDEDDDFDILWEAPGHRVVQIARYGYDPDTEDDEEEASE